MRMSRIVAAVVAGITMMTAAACGDSASTATSTTAATSTTSQAATSSASATGAQFSPGCAAVPTTGPGSFQGMTTDPVATAASNNPVLSTLVSAVKQAGLVDTLNSAKDITVFAPTNDAFAKIPKDKLDAVLADKATLTKILTYHVVGQRVSPEEMSSGTFETLSKGTVTTKGSGTDYTVNDAKVVCGNVSTANATVHIIDTVLMPQ